MLVHAEGPRQAVDAAAGVPRARVRRGAEVAEVEVEPAKVEGHEQFAVRGVSAGVFVVQEHAATAHHFDLRLEVDGDDALLGGARKAPRWTRPRETPGGLRSRTTRNPTTTSKARRGRAAWLTRYCGTYEQGGRVPWPEALDRGHAVFVLHGEKLAGGFALQRTRPGDKPQWLLIKRKDPDPPARPGSDVVAESR